MAFDVMGTLLELVVSAYDRVIGLALENLKIDRHITRALCDGEVAGLRPAARAGSRIPQPSTQPAFRSAR